MRIVHFSDWHGATQPLPPADLYACTGDMLPNFRRYEFPAEDGGVTRWQEHLELLGLEAEPRPPGEDYLKHPPDHAEERVLQERYLAHRGHGYMRELMGSPDAQVICCRGNHDFTELAPMFADGPTIEVTLDPERTWRIAAGGITLEVGGVRGMKRHHGRWSDELHDAEFSDLAVRLPDGLDLLVTHQPPEGLLDQMEGERIGSPALRAYLTRRSYAPGRLRAHLFGHVHEAFGTLELGGTLFSNAATGFNIIDL